MNPTGGEICFDFGNVSVQRVTSLDLYNVGGTGAVVTVTTENGVDVENASPMMGRQVVFFDSVNVLKICIAFDGPGGVAEIALCSVTPANNVLGLTS